jgi:lysophospholipase L1-like esterase
MIRRSSACGLLGSSLLVLAAMAAAEEPKPSLPKVVLIGDSIRMRYTPIVAKLLDGKAVVVSPKPNGGDSANVLKNLEEWAIREQSAVVHFNCGIHDTKKSKKTGKFQVPPDQYEANLRAIVGRIRAGTKATVVFATTTPVIDDRAAGARTEADYELLDASTEQYNAIARKVMNDLDVPVNDVRAALGDAETRARLTGSDGIHFQPEGYDRLAAAVAEFLTKHLPSRPRPAAVRDGPGRPIQEAVKAMGLKPDAVIDRAQACELMDRVRSHL